MGFRVDGPKPEEPKPALHRGTQARVLIADNDAVFRARLASALSAFPNIRVVGHASDAAHAITRSIATQPDVLLVDLVALRATSSEDTKRLARFVPFIRIVALSCDGDPLLFGDAFERGAIGVIDKRVDMKWIVARIVSAASTRRANGHRRTVGLSARERSILGEVAQGVPNKTIAWQLGISEKTVKNHLNRIFAVLGATSRTEAVIKAIQLGLAFV